VSSVTIKPKTRKKEKKKKEKKAIQIKTRSVGKLLSLYIPLQWAFFGPENKF
jgi:hypothetical protein